MSWRDRAEKVDAGSKPDWKARAEPSAEGEAGGAGYDPYAPGETEKQRAQANTKRVGTPIDAAKSWANSAALEAGPQIAGAMGAVANAVTAPLDGYKTSDLDAYRDVRDATKKELAQSGDTLMGDIGSTVGTLSTPTPKALPRGAAMADRALQAGKVGATLGGIHGLATSKADLTKPSFDEWRQALRDALMGGAGGFMGGAAGGAALAGVQPKLEGLAEEQALRAAGLQAGIKNSLKTDLGLKNMTEARALGRRFLDEGLIPPVGGSEAVAKRAEGLEGSAGNTIGSVLNRADVATMKAPSQMPTPQGTVAGRPSAMPQPQPGFDYKAAADAARKQLASRSAVADEMSGGKARDLINAFEKQGERTPGSFVGANEAKSDAWKSARFDADAPMSMQLYRQGVGNIRDDIERQVGNALGPGDAAALRGANEKYGVAADALKLAQNESQRRASRKAFSAADLAAILGGGTVGGMTGHTGTGIGTALATDLGAKAFDKYGHSSLSRGADFLAKQAASNTGGAAGAAAANELAPYLGSKAHDALAPYLELLRDKEREK